MLDENLTAAECAELARVLRQVILADRYPLSPRARRWKELLAKLDPTPAAETLPPPRGWINSTMRKPRR